MGEDKVDNNAPAPSQQEIKNESSSAGRYGPLPGESPWSQTELESAGKLKEQPGVLHGELVGAVSALRDEWTTDPQSLDSLVRGVRVDAGVFAEAGLPPEVSQLLDEKMLEVYGLAIGVAAKHLSYTQDREAYKSLVERYMQLGGRLVNSGNQEQNGQTTENQSDPFTVLPGEKPWDPAEFAEAQSDITSNPGIFMGILHGARGGIRRGWVDSPQNLDRTLRMIRMYSSVLSAQGLNPDQTRILSDAAVEIYGLAAGFAAKQLAYRENRDEYKGILQNCIKLGSKLVGQNQSAPQQ